MSCPHRHARPCRDACAASALHSRCGWPPAVQQRARHNKDGFQKAAWPQEVDAYGWSEEEGCQMLGE
eukprot:364050-Chlamydomonas_euryale.AAC.8